MKTKHDDSFYVTTFCNFAHRLSDGKPIEHECYILVPDTLVCEMEFGAAYVLEHKMPIHKGRIMRRGVRAR